MGRPLVAGADRDRRDTGVLERLDLLEQPVPRVGGSVETRLREEVLVVPEADDAGVERHAVLLAVDLVQPDRRRAEVADPTRRGLGDVLHETGRDLVAQTAAAPRLEQVGDVTGLQVGLQRGLERLVLHHRDVDRDVRVLGGVGVGHRLPVRFAWVVVLDVPPLDRDGLAALGGSRLGGRLSGWCRRRHGRGLVGRAGVGGWSRFGVVIVVATRGGDQREAGEQRDRTAPSTVSRLAVGPVVGVVSLHCCPPQERSGWMVCCTGVGRTNVLLKSISEWGAEDRHGGS